VVVPFHSLFSTSLSFFQFALLRIISYLLSLLPVIHPLLNPLFLIVRYTSAYTQSHLPCFTAFNPISSQALGVFSLLGRVNERRIKARGEKEKSRGSECRGFRDSREGEKGKRLVGIEGS